MYYVACRMLHVAWMSHVVCRMLHVAWRMSRVTCHMSHVACCMLHVACCMSHVTCHMSQCHMSHVTCTFVLVCLSTREMPSMATRIIGDRVGWAERWRQGGWCLYLSSICQRNNQICSCLLPCNPIGQITSNGGYGQPYDQTTILWSLSGCIISTTNPMTTLQWCPYLSKTFNNYCCTTNPIINYSV